MKIAVCAANKVGEELSKFIVSQEHPIEFAITCKNDSYEKKIYESFSSHHIPCYQSIDINGEQFTALIKEKSLDIVFSLRRSNIVKDRVIKAANIGFVNLHPSFLPYNRGKHPYYWALIDGTPSGVSIHYITSGIDDGAVICQKLIDTDITTTANILYENLLKEMVVLFKNNYDLIVSQSLICQEQDEDESTFHLAKEIEKHSEIDLNKNYKAIDLLNIMRARNFPNGPSSFFYLNDDKYYVNIQIKKAE